MYDTLSRRWGQRAEELETKGEFARLRLVVGQKRAAEDNDVLDGGAKKRRRDSTSEEGDPEPELGRDENDGPTHLPIAHRRSMSSPALIAFANPPSAPAHPERSLLSAVVPFPPLSNIAVLSAPSCSSDTTSPVGGFSFPYAPIRPLSPRDSSVRAEALVNVVRSFEAVLGYRADGWRRFGEALKGGAGVARAG